MHADAAIAGTLDQSCESEHPVRGSGDVVGPRVGVGFDFVSIVSRIDGASSTSDGLENREYEKIQSSTFPASPPAIAEFADHVILKALDRLVVLTMLSCVPSDVVAFVRSWLAQDRTNAATSLSLEGNLLRSQTRWDLARVRLELSLFRQTPSVLAPKRIT